MDLKCQLVEKVSEKSGKPYTCVVINITPTYQKTVFLEQAELELLKMYYGKEK